MQQFQALQQQQLQQHLQHQVKDIKPRINVFYLSLVLIRLTKR
jgi:hypothetical protein